MAKSIEVTISKDGEKVSVEGQGFVGLECFEATRPLEAALGLIESQDVKPEASMVAHGNAVENRG